MKTARDYLHLGGYALEPRVVRRYYGGGDPPQAQSTTTVAQNYSPEETARRNQVFDAAQGIYNKNAGAYSSMVNPNPVPVGPSAATTEAQNMIKSTAEGPGQQLANSAGGALNFGLSGAVLDPNSNPGLQGNIDTALRRVGNAYTDPGGVMSKIRGNFTAGNSGGTGTREGIASGIAGREYLNTVGDVTSSMTSDAYNKGLDYMKSSMAFAPNMYNLMMQPGMSVGAVGAQQEAYQQQQNDYTAGGNIWNLQKDWAALSPYASIVTGMSNPSTLTQGTAPGARGPGAMGILGGAAMGASIGSVVPGIGTGVGAGVGALIGLMQ